MGPSLLITEFFQNITHDLDAYTETKIPRMHRTDEFGVALGIPGPYLTLRPHLRHSGASWASKFKGAIVFAPEAGHPARQWPAMHAVELAKQLTGEPLILVGTKKSPNLPCDFDLRGQLSLEQLFELFAIVRCVISMDSGALHAASLLGTPVVAIFGGIDPRYRVMPGGNVRTLISDIECQPCNKVEICNGAYNCLRLITTYDVISEVNNVLYRATYN
jgi:ADP-heptose:LPS heptosyltransferase